MLHMRPIRQDSLPLIHSQGMKEYTVHLFCTGGAKHTRKFSKLNFTKAMPFNTTCTMYIQTLIYLSQNRVLCPNTSRILSINPVNKSVSAPNHRLIFLRVLHLSTLWQSLHIHISHITCFSKNGL